MVNRMRTMRFASGWHMTSRTRSAWTAAVAAVALGLLCGCGSGGSGSSEEGIEVALSLSNARSARNRDVPPAEEGQTFYTAEGKRIDLENGLVNVSVVGLIGCPFALRDALESLGRFLVSSAVAHGNAIEAPEGVLDVSHPDGTILDLGRLPALPGAYCGLALGLNALPSDVPGGDEGALAYLAPCYYPDSGTVPDIPGAPTQPDEVNHDCYQFSVSGTALEIRLGLPEAMTLDRARRHAALAVTVEYDTWFDGVDVPALAEGDAQAAQAFFGRIAASMHLIEHEDD